MGGRLPADRLRQRALASPPATPRRGSPSTRSAAGRSSPTRLVRRRAIEVQGRNPSHGLAVARMVAHITYLSESRSTGSSAASCRTARPSPTAPRRLPGRELSALPGEVFRRALRRQQLSVPDAGHGLFRPRRRASGRCRTPSADRRPLLRGLVHQRLAVPDHRGWSAPCLRRGKLHSPTMMGWMAPSRHQCAKVGLRQPTNGSHP